MNHSYNQIPLLPCPHCGSTQIQSRPYTGERWHVYCAAGGCGASVSRMSQQDAEYSWNKRTELFPDSRVESKVPLVLYFEDRKAADEFIAMVRTANPWMKEEKME